MKKTEISRKRIFGLDLMRSVAILAVLGSHILYIFPDLSGGIIPLLHLGGVMGVELFFVLSGYLIGLILFRIYTSPDFKISDFSYFIVRRWFRTLPNYYLVLLLNIILVTAIGRSLPEDLWSYFLFLQNFRSVMDIFFAESWSLPVEEFAYILGPLVLIILYWIFARARKQKVAPIRAERLFLSATIWIILVFLITKIIYTVNITDTSMRQWNNGLRAVLIYRIDAIFYGVLAAYISIKCKKVWLRYATPLLLLGVLLFIGFQFFIGIFDLIPEENPWLWGVVYLPFNTICCCCLLPFFSKWETAPKIISKPITALSVISYAIYLLHYGIVIQTMRWIWPIEGMSLNERYGYAAVYLCFLFLFCYAWYRLYEKPMMDLRDSPRIKKLFN